MKQWEDIIEVPLPLPFALKIINAYLIKGKTGYTIVDTGLHDEADLARWEQAQKEGNWSWADVEKIVLTHYHRIITVWPDCCNKKRKLRCICPKPTLNRHSFSFPGKATCRGSWLIFTRNTG